MIYYTGNTFRIKRRKPPTEVDEKCVTAVNSFYLNIDSEPLTLSKGKTKGTFRCLSCIAKGAVQT